jgi:redox-sensitive bicupin YhaK (pirin superfamily)
LVHATVSPGARLRLPWRRDFNALVYVLAGRAVVGSDGAPANAGQLALLGAGDVIEVANAPGEASALEVLVLGGAPIGEPVVQHGPFVMNTRAEIVQAFEDYQSGKMGSVPAVHIGD